jgi:hypothetical protein
MGKTRAPPDAEATFLDFIFATKHTMDLIKNISSFFLERKSKPKNCKPGLRSVILPIENSPGRFVFYCPGCDAHHIINTNPISHLPVHYLSGTFAKPTIRASVLSKGDKQSGKPHCHSFITKGEIKFLWDCTHQLAGKTVRLKPFKQ